MTDSIEGELKKIEQSLDQGIYKKGQWQRFLNRVSFVAPQDLTDLENHITDVSNKVHRRNHYLEVPFLPGLIVEICITLMGILCLLSDNPFVLLTGVVLLAIGLQPVIKVSTGTLLGIRYAYVYFLNVEPRFKMRYGTYLKLSPPYKVFYHLSGAIGTPAAMLLGYVVFRQDYLLLADACMIFFMIAALMQIGAFTAVWLGYRKIGGYVLEQLTSPATAASELKKYRDRVGRSPPA